MTVPEFEAMSLEILDSIKGLIARAPADQLDWRPAETVMTLGQLLEHTASSLTPVVKMAITQEFPPPEFMQAVMQGEHLKSITPAEAATLVDRDKAELSSLLAGISDEEWLSRQVSLPWGVTGSLGRCCAAGIDHASGHRYQLFLYLKLLGQRIGTAELFGMGG